MLLVPNDGEPEAQVSTRGLADQVVVLLEHGQRSAQSLPEPDRENRIVTLTEAAVRLRRTLA